MRPALCFALALAFATPVLAQGRYGPESSVDRNETGNNMPLDGRALGWAGKTVQTVAAPGPSNPYRSRPLAGGALRNTSALAANTPPLAPPAPAETASAAPPENAPWRRLTGASYAPAAPAKIASAAPTENAPWRRLTGAASSSSASAAPTAQPTTPVQAQRSLPAAAPPAAAQPDYRTDTAARSTPAPKGEHAHYYSLHREYGETPDPIALPEKTQVFLAGAPLSPRLDEQDDGDTSIDDTGKTAAVRKARLAADWGASADDAPAAQRVQVMRP